MKTLKRDALKKMLEEKKDFILVDVRGKECCFDMGHIPGAISIPLNEVEDRAPKELDKNKEIVVYCGSHACTLSPRAAHILENHMGYKMISHYAGGFKDWKDAGYQTEK